MKFVTKEMNDDVLETRMQHRDGSAVIWEEVLKIWESQPQVFVKMFRQVEFKEFFWKCKPFKSLREEYVHEIIRASGFRPADPTAFSGHFSRSEESVVVFSNTGQDAIILSPRPPRGRATLRSYASIASFMRDGPKTKQNQLFKALASTIRKTRNRKLWVNTNGLGVPWLHVRVDFTSKYY